MASVNKAIILGNLGRDPEIRTLQTGGRVAQLSIATNRQWKTPAGEVQEKTEWHRVVVFIDRVVDVLEKYARKGSSVYVEGQIETRAWVNKEGQERYATEIVLRGYSGVLTLLDRAPGDAGRGQDDATRRDMEDEIPF